MIRILPVDEHRFEKLGVGNDVELTRMAMRYGLLDERSENRTEVE